MDLGYHPLDEVDHRQPEGRGRSRLLSGVCGTTAGVFFYVTVCWAAVAEDRLVFVILCVVALQDVVGVTEPGGAGKLPASLFQSDISPGSRK